MTDRHGDKELKIFERFARAADLGVVPGTVERRLPPEPDVACLVDGQRIAFELVEIIDRDFAARTYGQLRLKSLFERMSDSEPWRRRLAAVLGNALVHITFQDLAFDAKRTAIPAVLDYLAQLDPLFQGELRPPVLASAVRSLRVARLEATGPFFDVDAVGSLCDPTVESVRAKCAKHYEAQCGIELLAYYELQPELPDQIWRPSLEKLLHEQWRTCAFQKVWVYDCAADAVRFAQTRPQPDHGA
jgi:hypothetical protein